MVRTVKSQREEEDVDDEEFISNQKEEKSGDRKANTNKSKHSEAEQRRRSKINERFQILRELIPENDQKRDKASFLLEVIQYIQFLQEKVQMYEGTYQGWSQEPSKLVPLRNSFVPVESFLDQSQFTRNGSVHEGNIAATPSVLTSVQNSIDPDFSGAAAFKLTNHGASSQTIPLDMPSHTNLFEGVTPEPPQESFSDAELLASQSESPLWHPRVCTSECTPTSYTPNHPEELKIENGGEAISNALSQGLLNTLSHALESSGVDLSQTSIQVQLDIGKRTDSGRTSMPFGTKDYKNASPSNQAIPNYVVGSSSEDSDQAFKRLRTERS